METIKTERLLIREMHADDAVFIVDLLNEKSFLAGIGDKNVRTLEDALRYIQSDGIDNYARYGCGMCIIELIDSGVQIGICGLLKRDFLEWPDVGFAIAESYHGQGYATEAARAAVEFGRIELGYNRICGITGDTNLVSQHVLEKIGLTFEKTFRKTEDGPEIRLYS